MENSAEEEVKSLCGHKSDMPVCMNCILSNKLQDSHLELLSDICESLSVSKKDKIRKDLLDLEDNIGPSYDSNLGKVEELLSSVTRQHKDRKNVILDLGDELHKVVDLVINKYLSEAGKMEKEDIDFLQSLKSKFKSSASEIKAAIKEYREFLATDNNKKLAKYQSKNEHFRKMPASYDVTVTKFQPKHLTEDKLCQIIGVIPWSVKTEIKPQENGISGSEASSVDSSPVAKNESSSSKSKDDKLSELNELMESISKATKDLVVALSPKVTRKLAVPKEFSSKATSQKEQAATSPSFAATVKSLKESKSKSFSSMNGHAEITSKTTVQTNTSLSSSSKIPTPSSPKTSIPSSPKTPTSSQDQKVDISNPSSPKTPTSLQDQKVEISNPTSPKTPTSPQDQKVEISNPSSPKTPTSPQDQKVEISNPSSPKTLSGPKDKKAEISSPKAKSEISVAKNMEIDIPIEPMNEPCVETDPKSTLTPSKEPNCILDPKCSPVNEPCEETHQWSILKSFKEPDGLSDLKCSPENEPCEEIHHQRSILKPSKHPNGILDPRCHSETQKDSGCLDDSPLLITKHIAGIHHVKFSSKATAELSKENKEAKSTLYHSEELNNLSNASNGADDEVVSSVNPTPHTAPTEHSSVMESTKREKRDDGPLLDFFSSTDLEANMVSEETNIFANAPWVMDTMETGYTYTYKIACASSTNQIFVCGNNKIIKQMNSEGKFVEKATTESGNQPFDLALTSDAQLMYSDHNGKCVNVVRNNGKIENLIKFQKWFPMALCTTAANDLLVTMESEDLVMCKVVRYSGSKVKQEIQFNVKGEQLYCRADFIDENANLDVVVSDLGARRVVVVDKYGIFRFNYSGNMQSNRYKSFGCSGVATNSKCHIVVADEYNDVLHVIDQNGQFLTYVDNCKLQRPGDLCADGDDILYVIQPVTNQVKKIKLYR
ncbi:uncharacterized protein [Magallana gigas]|uniref:uncharacterized protein n=1 Tax=Magallana gigas TaxID=29159 RepID=UPI00333F46FE